MSDAARPIDEDDLHAFVDGQLTPDRRASLQRYLDSNPDAARRVAAYQLQRDGHPRRNVGHIYVHDAGRRQ